IQAARGTRWVWALTFASTIEALVKMLPSAGTSPTPEEAAEVDAVVEHIRKGCGSERLKSMGINSVRRSLEMTTIKLIRGLKNQGVVTAEQQSAWEKMRNAVMHGSLVSPYSNEEEDEQLRALAQMVHALTREVLR